MVQQRKRGTVLKFAVLLEIGMVTCMAREGFRIASLVDVEATAQPLPPRPDYTHTTRTPCVRPVHALSVHESTGQ